MNNKTVDLIVAFVLACLGISGVLLLVIALIGVLDVAGIL